MKTRISVIAVMLICQFCSIAPCSNLELTPKESDFTHENYLTSLRLLKDATGQCKKKSCVSWELREIGIPNALIRFEGYLLELRKQNAILEINNARLREDRDALDKAACDLKQVEEEIKKFLAEKRYAD
jgi:hypothetical protein